ncbi:UDP-glucosyltransferase 2 [Andrena cerasifolii]|uniref:UDP-glucosyltransferase 2 n=1 Tax=Andrena cerasifolii TaxID=2819439 RepID=UPI0040378C77
MKLLTVLAVIACVVFGARGARILALFSASAKSHYNVFEPLLKRLSEKGHAVVSVNYFPQKVPLSNFTDVDISGSKNLVGAIPLAMFENMPKWVGMKILLGDFSVSTCDTVLDHPKVKQIIQAKEKFDVFITEIFITDCCLGMAHVLNIPIVVGAISSVSLPWSNEIMRNPEIPSYIPNWASGYTDQMDFFERSANLLFFLGTKLGYRYLSDTLSYEIAKKHFGDDLPDLDTLRSKTSLILTNGHSAISTPRALAPGFKELGGIHIPTSGPQPLPNDLQDYLDAQGKHGVVYFSLGSQVDPSTMRNETLATFYKAFEQLPQQILWKCPEQRMPKLPKNVRSIEWAPQLSILCHPNVRLFITHGGLLGTQEAVYCGVPILGMPLFGDQHLNMAYFVKKGLALQLGYGRLSYEPVSKALNELLTNKSFAETARKASLQFRDRQVPPLEEGVYWIEYLIRHGPNSLKTAASNLTWYQYLLLDVLLAMVTSLLLVSWILYKLLKLAFHWVRTVSIDSKKKLN